MDELDSEREPGFAVSMYTEASAYEAKAPAPYSRALSTLRHPEEQGGSQTRQEVEKEFLV